MVDLFVEDRAHEELLRPLAGRLAREEELVPEIRSWTARGGHARAIREFKLYQDSEEQGVLQSAVADIVVVGIDGNCSTFREAREGIRGEANPAFADRVVVACPEPHVERWYLADPTSFEAVVGSRPRVGRGKCARDHYKQILAEAVRRGGHPRTAGGIDFAAELVNAMDPYRAGKNVPSLKAFLDDLRAALRRIRLALNPGNGT